MLNLSEGAELSFHGERCIRSTGRGRTHLVFGPYVDLEPGRYLATFHLARGAADVLGEELCAILDVAAEEGGRVLANRFIFGSQLGDGLAQYQLAFELAQPARRVEFRVRANASWPIIAADNASAGRSDDRAEPPCEAPDCDLVRDHPEEIVDLFVRGYRVLRADRSVRFMIDGITIEASERDDLNFAGEVFESRAYNVVTDAEVCAIDIGLNVGLTSLLFASKPNVREVHSFEPFPVTYAKALRNLSINPAIASKVTAHNVGLSDRDDDQTILVPDTTDSGSRATISVVGGRPVELKLRDAAGALGPIIAAARSKGRQIVLKVDCEGSEFAIFDSLDQAGLFGLIDVLLVEWHAMFPGKTASDLIRPLLLAGFTIVDLSPREGNGFFYAIRNLRPKTRGIKRRLNLLLIGWRAVAAGCRR